jgi:hypothetical protein
VIVPPAPPRQLPRQDHAALDAAERVARHLTWAVAAGAFVLALMLVWLLGARLRG